MPKLRLGTVVNLGGRLSHEFAIFAKKICIELLFKYITLKSIFINNLILAIVRIPLFFIDIYFLMKIKFALDHPVSN